MPYLQVQNGEDDAERESIEVYKKSEHGPVREKRRRQTTNVNERKEWIGKFKDRRRAHGMTTANDSKYSGRKRTPKF